MTPPIGITEPPGLRLQPDLAIPVERAARAQTDVGWFSGQMRIVWALVLLFAAGFLAFYPRALTNFDEVSYVRQAVAFASGSTTVDAIDPLTGQHQRLYPSDYPAGTATLMVPFVWLGGWRGTFLLGLLALSACTLFTARWIVDSGHSPLYALIVLGYLPAMVIARTAMSDLPSACMVAAGLWLFWDEKHTTPWRRLAAGFLAGASICLREPNPILFAFFFLGALVRRERHLLPLIAGGLAGVALRPLLAEWAYGSPVYVKEHPYGFTGMLAWENLAIYLVALLLLVPGGLIFTLFYRGKRRIELIATVVVYIAMFVAWDYNGSASGGLRQWILSMRFLIPAVPIVAFAMAHTCSRWYLAISAGLIPRRRVMLQRSARAVVALWVLGIVAAGTIVNVRSQLWSRLHEQIVQTLYSDTDPGQPIMADLPATVKFLNELYGKRMLVNLDLGAQSNEVRRAQLLELLRKNPTVQIVLFDRDDSEYWLNKLKEDEYFVDSISQQLHATMKVRQRFPGLGVLRIWSVSDRS